MEMNNKMVFDERAKELTNTVISEMELFGDKKYGHVVTTTKVKSTINGTARVLMYLENQKKGITNEVEKFKQEIGAKETQLKLKQEDLTKLNKEIRDLKKAVGTRINLNKILKDLQTKDKADAEKKAEVKE